MQLASKIAKLHLASVFLLLAPLPAPAYEPATIAQLERMLVAAHGMSDKVLAKRLGELELTERLSTVRLRKLQVSAPGEKSRQALLVLSDISAFHDLPAGETPQLAAPDKDTQSKILSKIADYIREELPRQIDIVVSRDTAHFDNLKVVSFNQLTAAAVVENQPYHFIEKTSDTVNYRNGAEEVPGLPPAEHRQVPPQSGLTNWGVFGPLLEVVVNDISGAKTEWGHWEQGRKGTLAVFRYDVPEDQSNYNVQYCCFISDKTWDFSGDERWNVYESLLPSYHGEIAVDPATGAILRLTVQTVIPAGQPIYSAEVLVEYGPVQLGGREYLLPMKSATISVAPIPMMVQSDHCVDAACVHGLSVHPKDTVISDTVYHSYHVFRGEPRILPTDVSDATGESPSSSQPQNGTLRKQP